MLIVITGWEKDFKSMAFELPCFLFLFILTLAIDSYSSEINQNPIEAYASSLGCHWFSSVIYRSHSLEVGIQAEDFVKCWRKFLIA